jgi:hypothetical protein
MTGDVDEEVGDNDENALDWGDGLMGRRGGIAIART